MAGYIEGSKYTFHPAMVLPEESPDFALSAEDTSCADGIIDACKASDIYEIDSLIEIGLSKDQTIDDAPDDLVSTLATALAGHHATQKVCNSPHLIEVIREHDKESYAEHAKKADLLVHILRELVGEDGTISQQDFNDWACLYDLMPDSAEEQERFTRIFATRNGVYFDEIGHLHVRPLSFKQSLRVAGRISTAMLLDKVTGMTYDTPPLPAPPKPEPPVPKPKPQQIVVTDSIEAKLPYISPIEHLRDADGKLPVPTPPRRRLLSPEEAREAHTEARAERRAAAFRQELRAHIEAYYERLPYACIVTDYEIRRRALKETSFFGRQDTKAIMRELIAEDERFTAWDANKKIFTIIKPDAPKDTYAKLERIIQDQQQLTARALNIIEKQMRKIRRWERNITTTELRETVSFSSDTDVSLVHYLARLDPRISSVANSKLHFTVPMDKRKPGRQPVAGQELGPAILTPLTPDMTDTQTAPNASEPEVAKPMSVAKRLSRLARQVYKWPWRRA